MGNNEEKKDNALALWKIFLGLFFLTYFLWYFNGGPEKWNEKLEGQIKIKNIQNNLLNSGIYIEK